MANGAKPNVLRNCQEKGEALNAEDVGKQFHFFDVVLEFRWWFNVISDDLLGCAVCGLALESGNAGATDLD